jgi:hypothetical protein
VLRQQVQAGRASPSAARPPAMARQLPAAGPHFVGRAAELKALTALLDATAVTAPVAAISGPPGVGKTILAVSWAHQVADHFPDGQLYVNLRGFDPSGQAATPGEVIRDFLDAFGVPAERMPTGLPAQAGLYRSLLAGKRVLVVLDNARDAAQVRPLLPGAAGCLAVATSRSKLTSLIAGEGASPVTLDVLTSGEAADLLARGIGAERAASEPDAARELIESCARLPLALSIAAARAAIRPGVPLAAQAAELRDAQTRLDALNAGEEASSVRAVFSWSCEQLGAPAARMFRLLGLHPGPDISLSAASSLAGVTRREALAALDELTLSSLLTERRPGRYSLHDLLRAYAAELAAGRGGEAGRHAAMRRMLDHYLLSSYRAATLMDPLRRLGPLPATAPEVIPDQLASQDEALAWCQTEYPVLMRATELAAASGFGGPAWQITWALSSFFFGSVRPEEWHAAGLVALSAAIAAGDSYGQAHMQHGLGGACTALGRYDDARTRYAAALQIYEQLGDRSGQARAHIELGLSYEYRERHRDVFGARPAQAGAGQPDSIQPDSIQPD